MTDQTQIDNTLAALRRSLDYLEQYDSTERQGFPDITLRETAALLENTADLAAALFPAERLNRLAQEHPVAIDTLRVMDSEWSRHKRLLDYLRALAAFHDGGQALGERLAEHRETGKFGETHARVLEQGRAELGQAQQELAQMEERLAEIVRVDELPTVNLAAIGALPEIIEATNRKRSANTELGQGWLFVAGAAVGAVLVRLLGRK